MTRKPVVPRVRALRDADEAIDYYLRKAGEKVAIGFVGALERAYRRISLYPGSGSPRYAHELDLPGLRCWALKRFPYLVFYVEQEDHVDVWRILHGERNIPAWLRAETR